MLFSRARARLHALRSAASMVLGGLLVRGLERWIARWLAERGSEDPSFVRGDPAEVAAWEAFHGRVDWGRFENHRSPATVRAYEDGVDGPVLVERTLFEGTVLDLTDPTNASFAERRRHDFIHDQVLSRLYVALAQAWKKDRQEARNLSMLPHDADGIHWPFAGPIMARELWMTQFILIAVLGVEPSLAVALGKRILNEWHDLEPEAGLTDDEKTLLGLEREEQRA